MYVNVEARAAGVPYSFKNVQVASIADLRARYEKQGIEILGYTIVNAPPQTNIPGGGPPILTPGTVLTPGTTNGTGTPSKGVWILGGLLVLWWLWS